LTAAPSAAEPTHRVELPVVPEAAEAAAASLWAAGALGVWERPGQLVAWFHAPVDLAGLPGLATSVPAWSVEPPRDWQAAWKATIQPVRAGGTVLVPSWLIDWYTPEPGDLTLVLDPGQAFGSGHHATTALCLEALERLDLDGASVADIGCGTGVLAIAAARRGATEVLAIDLDPDAVAVTRANAARNQAGVTALVGSIDAIPGPVDVVVANLVTDVLVDLAGPLVAATRGTLVVSGIAAERGGRVVAALEAAGARVERREDRDGWVALVAHPAADGPSSSGGPSAPGGPSSVGPSSPTREGT
jgi:ribosomal protein L11 methyltransferase